MFWTWGRGRRPGVSRWRPNHLLSASRPLTCPLSFPQPGARLRPSISGTALTICPPTSLTGALPSAAYDVVLLANICHLFDEERNRALLRRLRPTVRPGGLLAIIDVLPSPDPEKQRWISVYAFFLRLRTSRGSVYPLATYETWTSDAGLGPLQVEPLSAAPSLSLLVCRMK
jgi:O-methyltransferase domain